MKCHECGQDTFLPFRCQYCGRYFCSDHRLPENHKCSQAEKALLPKVEEKQPLIVQEQRPREYTVFYPPTQLAKRRIRFSKREARDLTIATLLVIGIGLSLFGFPSTVYGNYSVLSLSVAVFTMSFFAHEMAHKIVAQGYGLWAEFRLTLIGAILALFSMVSPFIKIISPGAVMVAGSPDRRTMGKTSIAGPTTNMIFATILLATGFLVPNYASISALLAFFNAWIAVFNLIPFGILDGFKVFTWNKMIWALVFTASIALTLFSYQHL